MSEEQSNFKVTDRRLFNADGTPREVPPEEKPDPQPAATETVTASPAAAESKVEAAPKEEIPERREAAAPEEDEDVELPEGEDPASFVNFLMSIASNAASALGMMEHPVTHQREVDLELGKHWIDVLAMLQQKTRGNLTPQETKILDGLLADLRMQYVSLINASQSKVAGPYSGRDIIGGK